MNLLFLSGSSELGGAERVLLDIVASLRGAQPSWTVHLIAPAPGPLVAAAVETGATAEVLAFGPEISRLGEPSAKAGTSGTRLATNLVRTVAPLARYGRQLRARVKTLSPDVIHCHGLKVHLLAGWANPGPAPVIWHLHDFIGRRPATSVLLKRSLRRCAAVVANSASVAADARNVLGGQVSLFTVLNGVDLDRFSPDGPCAELDEFAPGVVPRAGIVRVGLVATYARWKGHRTFLEACARLPRDLRVHAYVVGGPLYQTDHSQVSLEELRGHVDRLGIADRVTLTGFIPTSDSVMRALDIVVHASVESEPFGLAIAEAMACGRAVVAADAGGARELVTSGVDGLMHRPGDAASLADAIASLAADRAQRLRLGVAARQTAVRRLDRRRFARELGPVYERVAARVVCA